MYVKSKGFLLSTNGKNYIAKNPPALSVSIVFLIFGLLPPKYYFFLINY
jgi:hypothetical protein